MEDTCCMHNYSLTHKDNSLPYFSIHFCLTYRQTEPGIADRFINDVTELTKEIMKNPGTPSTGAVSLPNLIVYYCT